MLNTSIEEEILKEARGGGKIITDMRTKTSITDFSSELCKPEDNEPTSQLLFLLLFNTINQAFLNPVTVPERNQGEIKLFFIKSKVGEIISLLQINSSTKIG